ncbi:MAG: hypothetical protein HWE08_00670 [Alphaproteobacteria bacterium]|nr:hypothetical protein [Alphaproteobacteria bacterium]
MTMASLTSSLLARKGHAQPSANARDIFAPAGEAESKRWQSPVKTKPERPPEASKTKTQLSSVPSHKSHEKESGQKPPRSAFAPDEARHTRLVHAGEVAPKPVKAEEKTQRKTTRKHKSLRLEEDTDLQLRLLAARRATSQQALMEEALKQFLEHETEKSRCICGSKKG